MKFFAVPLLMVLAVTMAFADPPDENVLHPNIPAPKGYWYGELFGGANLTLFSAPDGIRPPGADAGPTTLSLYQSAFGIGPLAGLSVGYQFNRTYGVTVSAAYDVRSAGASGVTKDICRDGNLNIIAPEEEFNKEYSVKFSYITLSATGNYRYGNVVVFAGTSSSIPLSHTITETGSVVNKSSPCYLFPSTPDSTKSVTATLVSDSNMTQRISGVLGVGYILDLTSHLSIIPRLSVDLAIDKMLTNDEPYVFKPTGAGGNTRTFTTAVSSDLHLNSLQATIGLRYKF